MLAEEPAIGAEIDREDTRVKISQKGLYALQAMMTLARRYRQGVVKVRDIASEADVPGNFLEQILVELRNAQIGRAHV